MSFRYGFFASALFFACAPVALTPAFAAKMPSDQSIQDHLPKLPTLESYEPKTHSSREVGVLDDANKVIAQEAGILGDSVNDLESAFTTTLAHYEGYVDHPGILQCTGSLPFRGAQYIGGLSAITQLKHTWLQSDGRTFGMPYTLDQNYFGGDAVIQSPDAFQKEHMQDIACSPVLFPEQEDAKSFKKKFECIADKASTTALGSRSRQLVLAYNALEENCLAAVRFVVECAGGKIPQLPNLDIGGSFDPNHPAKFRFKDDAVLRAYDSIFSSVQAVDQALAQDLRANPKLAARDFLRMEAMKFTDIQESVERASQLIERNYPETVLQNFRYGNQTRREHWSRYALDIWRGELQGQNYGQLAEYLLWLVRQASTDFPSSFQTTVEAACQQLRSECE